MLAGTPCKFLQSIDRLNEVQPQSGTMKPRILLITTRRWFSAARLAMAFSAAGCRVDIVCPRNHPALLTRGIALRHPFNVLSPIRSLHSTICKSRPDLLIPTDEIAANYLYRLYEEVPGIEQATSPFVRELLERSLGEPASFHVLSSRTRFLAVAKAEGIPIPPTHDVPDQQSLERWLSANPLPAVLKADLTSRGEGVKIVCSRKEALDEWRKLRAPFGLAQVLRKSGFESDTHHILPWLKRRTRAVSIQPYISGQDSNIAVACWEGQLLGAISVDVLRACRPKGPGALVELSQGDQMLKTARTLVQRLNLSGLCGFDFVVEDGTGRAYLIEINARATQTCHLPYGVPRDLISSLVAALAGHPLPPVNEARKRGIIALFPLAWQAGVSKAMLDSTLQDIPWEEPRLVAAGFARNDKSFYSNLRMWPPSSAPGSLAGQSK
jgi:hypothetical protein